MLLKESISSLSKNSGRVNELRIEVSELPKAQVGMILRNAGADRMSEDATNKLAKLLEAEGTRIAKKAAALATHAGRKPKAWPSALIQC